MRHNWKTPLENLEHTKPDVTHLRVFGCSTYVFLPEEVRHNKLNPKSKLMTFIGYPQGIKGYLFMRSPNNVLFTVVQALFDKTLYLKCPDMHCPGYTPAPDQPDGEQGEYNIPPDDEFGGNGGGPLPLYGPAGGPRPQLPPWQPLQSRYPPLPPSPPNHPTPPISSGLPSPVRSHAPSPSPWHSPAPSSDYDHYFFFSKEDEQEYFRKQAIWRQGVEKKKAKEATKYHNAGGNEPLDYDVNRNLYPYLWYRLQNNLVAQPQEGPSGSQPRCSGRARQPVVCPNNIYGNQNPIESEWMSNQGFQRLTEGVPAPSGSGNRPESPPYEGKGKKRADYLAWIVQEGGAGLINFLLSSAVKPTDGAGGKLPDVRNVHEWHYRDLMCFPEAAQKEWKTACLEELESLRKHSIFKLTDPPKGHKIIGCRWVFDIKSDSQKKARLVAQGFSQVEGLNYNELFSPVVRFESVRVIFALASLNGWYMTGVDVRTAYLYGKLDEEIYMRQPEGFIATGQENKVICLQRALYGLKQAGLAWWKELSQSMKVLGFKRLNSDARIFVC
jgi:Reverse transcriptase (RNA-dependent DNA polymerase)